MSITLRLEKGTPLTHTELDGNFIYLSSSYLMNTTDTLTGDLTVTGKITAQEFHTQLISSSIIYKSGSTKFGDTPDDRHQFTGSVNLKNNLDVKGESLFYNDITIDSPYKVYTNYIEENSTNAGLDFVAGTGGHRFTGSLDITGSVFSTGIISGSLLVSSGDVIAFNTSDIKLKENLKPIENPLDKIQKVNGYEFDWNPILSYRRGRDIGVIAQEVENILPEIVRVQNSGYKGVAYEKIIPLLIEGIKELLQRVENLENK